MWDDTVLVGVAAADRTAKLTDDSFLELPYGIGIKQGNVALKRWVDSRLEPDEEEGHVPADPQEQRAGAVRARLLEEHPAAEQHVRVRAAGLAERGHRLLSRPRSVTTTGSGRARAAASSVVLEPLMLLVTYDLWAFVSENREELVDGLLNTLKVSAIGDRGRLRDRRRARRRPCASHPGRQPVRRRLRRGDPQHADPRPDLHDLLRAARSSGSSSTSSRSRGSP